MTDLRHAGGGRAIARRHLPDATELGVALDDAILGSVGSAVYRDQIADAVSGETPVEGAAAGRDSLAGVVARGPPAAGPTPGAARRHIPARPHSAR